MRRLLIATAGWSIPRELAPRVPDAGSALQKYATLLQATEINSTFQRQHRPSTFERWHDSVPEAFRFAVKLPRSITHEAALASPRAALQQFLEDVRGLGAKLGPLLVQLPQSVPFDRRRVATFLRILRELHSGAVACEPRHASWYSERADALLIEHQVARVIADPARPNAASRKGGWPGLRYLRLHGSPRIYYSAYGPARLHELAGELRADDSCQELWCVFDNTASGAALHDALLLRDLLAERERVVQPVRLQRSRRSGARLRSPNGLEVVCISRPSPWGNPFAIELGGKTQTEKQLVRAQAAAQFRTALENGRLPFSVADVQRELRGKNVACWCPLDGPCHGDVLLEWANR